ncbi:hypothetical protein MMYC01_202568 [Madurella mycetomatis]|uniref:Uncharacterized protein n=1 Tax=Madurella mycetomatis TaxID=100816 RepID=A0A175W547_9PEZI|nr:hypothetical protein MMYC01_202568 [Madurella mycetomatis]
MCTVAYNIFNCGCRSEIADTLTPCEYAKLKGHICPDFQISEDPLKSKTFDLLA